MVSVSGLGGGDRRDRGDGGALCDEPGQERERTLGVVCVHEPPDLVAAVTAGAERVPAAEGAGVALPGGERDAALVGGMPVLQQVAGHLRPRTAGGAGRSP